MRLAAGDAPAAVEPVNKVKIFPVCGSTYIVSFPSLGFTLWKVV
jgi:hypothetical protein